MRVRACGWACGRARERVCAGVYMQTLLHYPSTIFVSIIIITKGVSGGQRESSGDK